MPDRLSQVVDLPLSGARVTAMVNSRRQVPAMSSFHVAPSVLMPDSAESSPFQNGNTRAFSLMDTLHAPVVRVNNGFSPGLRPFLAIAALKNPMTRSFTACGHGAIEIAMGGLQNKRRRFMAIIGTFIKDGNGYAGNIETLTLKAKLTFEPTDKKSDKAPDYRVFHISDNFTSEIGAAWKKTSKDGGEYLSVSIDDPSFADKINCRLVKTGSEQGHSLYWDRQRPRD
jgi:uncharacterized protein (DUF736 family)